MTELQRLIEQYNAGIRDLDNDALDELLGAIRTESEAALDGDPDDETLDLLQQAAEAVAAIKAEQTAREEAAANRGATVQSLRDSILNDGSEGEGEETPPPAEGEGEGDGEGTQDPPPAVAAGARPQGGARANARRPASMQRPPEGGGHGGAPERPELTLVAAANLPDVQAGTPLDTPETLARAFMAAHNYAKGYKGPRTKVPVARIGVADARELYGPERFLGRDQQLNDRLINSVVKREVTTLEALGASGGICAPINVNYDMPTVGIDDRPVRDKMMTKFGADRGGVSTFPPPTLADVGGAVAVWTEANDQNPSSPATKPCLTMTCPDEDTTVVEAITRCFEIGNMRARYWQEQVEAWVNLGAVVHARKSEIELLTHIGSGSTQVTTGQVLGATADVLGALGRATAQIANRHRLSPQGQALTWGYPWWLHEVMREDIVRQMPGTGTYDEKMAIADSQIEAWCRVRNVMPVPFLDGETGQIFGTQGDGPLLGWPSTVVTYLYPAGSWLFLDGGELDLGIVRDSTLNSTNDYQIFYESFEGAHFHGIESYRLTMDICPDGSVAGTADITGICNFGS